MEIWETLKISVLKNIIDDVLLLPETRHIVEEWFNKNKYCLLLLSYHYTIVIILFLYQHLREIYT